MPEPKHKLRYRIAGRRSLNVSGASTQPGNSVPDKHMEMVDVEWTHEDGFKPDTKQLPVRYAQVEFVLQAMLAEAVTRGIIGQDQAVAIHAIRKEVFTPHERAPEIGLLTVEDSTREIVGDQFNVAAGTPDSIIMQMCEEKRARLAEALGVEP